MNQPIEEKRIAVTARSAADHGVDAPTTSSQRTGLNKGPDNRAGTATRSPQHPPANRRSDGL